MEIGIVGLPNVGKSSLFNALTESQAQEGNFPFTTIDPNIGVVEIEDERLDFLAKTYNLAKKVPATIKFVDIAGLVKNAAQGEGLGNQFLGHIRSVDAIAEVVRCFDNLDVVHISGEINPEEDIQTINTELLLADLEQANKALKHLESRLKKQDKEAVIIKNLLIQAIDFMDQGRSMRLNGKLAERLTSFQFLSAKPLLYIANIGEKNDMTKINQIRQIAEVEGAKVLPVAVKTELEILELPEAERRNYREELGLSSSLEEVASSGYEILDLITFFTMAGPKEARAWTVSKGTKAPQAAGKIHTDFERGFIRAEVFHFDDLKKLGNEKAIREAGKLRSEGKNYIVQDGDVIEFLFNV